MTATSLTDSQVSAAVLGKMLTTSFPLCLVTMEAAAQMEQRGYDLSLLWVPREHNVEADALSNMQFGQFSVEHRVDVDLENLPFLVLPQLMEQASRFYNTVRRPRRRRQRGSTVQAPSKPLREADPW